MIRNNTIGAGRLYFLANEGRAAPTEDISIIGNRFVGKAMTIRVNPPSGTRSRYRVIGNVERHAGRFNGGGAFPFSDVVGHRGPRQRPADAAQPRDLRLSRSGTAATSS